MADSRVLATARHIHICLRVAVLRDSSHFRRFRPAGGGEASRAWHLWSSSARCSRSRPHSRSMRRRSRRLRGDKRRNASSADTPPRLAPCLAAHPTNRVVACRSVRHSTPRPFLTFRYGAFFFVVFALADLSSAHLSASTTARQIRTPVATASRLGLWPREIRGQLINRSSPCADRQQRLCHYCAQLQCPNTRG